MKRITNNKEDFHMAKAGMRRPDPKAPHGTEGHPGIHIPKNEATQVKEIQGKAKCGHEKAAPIKYDGK